MKIRQIASEYQALINIFIEEGMVVHHKSKYTSLQAQYIGRVSDKGDDWSVKVNYFNLALIVRGNGEIVIQDARDGIDKIETPLETYIAGIRNDEQRQDAEYKHTLIKALARNIQRAHITPAVLAEKIETTKSSFALMKANAMLK